MPESTGTVCAVLNKGAATWLPSTGPAKEKHARFTFDFVEGRAIQQTVSWTQDANGQWFRSSTKGCSRPTSAA